MVWSSVRYYMIILSQVDISTMQAVIKFANDSAFAHVSFRGKVMDCEVPAPFLKAFQEKFPKDSTPGSYEVYTTLFVEVFSKIAIASQLYY